MTTYYCQSFLEGEDENGDVCYHASPLMSGSDCEDTTQAAYDYFDEEKQDELECWEGFIEVECTPDCPEQYAMKTRIVGGCEYKVTFKICCCNGVVIDEPTYSASLAFAKFKARTFACALAKLRCCGNTRGSKWEICRVPAGTR